MSMIRRAAVGAIVLGAGLASTAGVAMANDSGHDHGGHGSHGHSASCTNVVGQENASKNGGFLASVADGDNVAVPVNVCDVLNDNHVLNHISVSVLSGIIPT
jgi:hypothetical protein